MKISKIYASHSKFKPINFNEGFNIIFGEVEEGAIEDTGVVHEHNLGKSALVELIDFLLLQQARKESVFVKQNKKFSDWFFFLEIRLNDGSYLTIRRGVNPNNTVSFKHHQKKGQDFSDCIVWDYENLNLGTRDESKNPKHILESKYLRFDVIPEYDFRSFLPYILRDQDSFGEVFELKAFYKHRDWKPMLFNLLGYNSALLSEKYELDEELKTENKILKKMKDKDDPEKLYKLQAAIEAKSVERDEMKKLLNNFDFYKKEEGINYDLVRGIESQIAELNKEVYSLNYAIEQVRASLDSSSESPLDIQHIEEVFRQASIYLPEQLVKEYDQVLNFSSQITKERKKYLKEELESLSSKETAAKNGLRELNTKRSDILSVLNEKDTFVKYKTYQDDLLKAEGEVNMYTAQLEAAKTTESYQRSIELTEVRIKELTEMIRREIDKENNDIKAIKVIFQDIYKKTFEYVALLVVQPNRTGNVDFSADILGLNKDLTGKAEGYTSTKVLCASFTLAILIHYAQKSFFRFAYHDGILESWGDNHKKQFIRLVKEYCERSGIQYILSMIQSDVPKGYQFEKGEIVRTLSKKDLLFGFEF